MCGSAQWQRLMAAQPESAEEVPVVTQIRAASERCFEELSRSDWLEAFAAHSTIGAPRADDQTGGREQAGIDGVDDELLSALAEANDEYRRRFGFVFLIRASGRTAEEMLAALRRRLTNSPETEFANACAAQREITALRIEAIGKARGWSIDEIQTPTRSL